MRLTSLVISFDLAQTLYDAGIHNESVFYWFQEKAPEGQTLFETGVSQKTMPWKIHVGKPSKESRNIYKEIPAPTCSEIGDMLPGVIVKEGITYYIGFFRTDKKEWLYFYKDKENKAPNLVNTLGKTEQDARAALLNMLLWNKFINLTDTI